MSNSTNFAAMSIAQLVVAYNAATGSSIKHFQTKAIAVARTEKAVKAAAVAKAALEFVALQNAAGIAAKLRSNTAVEATATATSPAPAATKKAKTAKAPRAEVTVDGIGYDSIRAACIAFGMVTAHARRQFRVALKAAGTLAFGTHTFTIVA